MPTAPDAGITEVKYSTCYFCTSKGCGVKIRVAGGRIQKVVVDTDCPATPGSYCDRPHLSKEYQEHPFRLSWP